MIVFYVAFEIIAVVGTPTAAVNVIRIKAVGISANSSSKAVVTFPE